MPFALMRSAVQHPSATGPLYMRLTRVLREAIAQGSLEQGDVLPPERDLAVMLGVSRVTLRKSLQLLSEEGLICAHQGTGTLVNGPIKARLPSFSQIFRNRGVEAYCQWIAQGLHAPTTEEIMALGLPMQAQVARLERLRFVDGQPIGIERSSLPAEILPQPSAVQDSLYAWLEANSTAPVRAIQRVFAANITPRDAETLGILNGTAVLRIERISYLASGKVAELSRAIYRADAYDVVTEITA